MGKLKAIFVLAENLSLVLTKLNTELGLAQPQLVFPLFGAIIIPSLKLYLRFSLALVADGNYKWRAWLH